MPVAFAEKIINLIKELRPYEQIDVDTELIKSGVLDSLAVLGLVTLIEDEFEVEIEDDAVTAENFATVISILKVIETSNKLYGKEFPWSV